MDGNVMKSIVRALELINGKGDGVLSSDYSSCFLFGTENQEGINSVINYANKDVCTVASSGDQYVSAVYYGAKKVDLYDINYLTEFLTYLKIASFITLDYEEFIDFLIPIHEDCSTIKKRFWNLETLKKVLPNMPERAAYFWDNVMYVCHKVGFDGNFIVPKNKHSYMENIIKGMPFYANKEEYYKLQSTLRKREYPTFKQADVRTFGEVFNDKYDIIYLSNIIECLVCEALSGYYMPSYGAEDRLEERYIFELIKQVLPKLREDGLILLDYRPNSSKDAATDLLFNNDYFEVTEIASKYPPSDDYRKCSDTDLVLTYCPKKTGNILDLLK